MDPFFYTVFEKVLEQSDSFFSSIFLIMLIFILWMYWSTKKELFACMSQQQRDNAELLKHLNYILQKFIEARESIRKDVNYQLEDFFQEVRDSLQQVEELLQEQKEKCSEDQGR